MPGPARAPIVRLRGTAETTLKLSARMCPRNQGAQTADSEFVMLYVPPCGLGQKLGSGSR